MKQISIIILSIIVFALTACEKVRGDGPIVTEARTVDNFTGIDLRIDAQAFYRVAPDYKVVISGQQNILDVLEAYTDKGKLVIRYRGDVRVRSHEPLHIEITSPSVNRLNVDGRGDLFTSGPINSSRMDMDISGSGSISVSELSANFIDAVVSGSGNIRVAGGSATEVKTLISGSGDIDLLNVPAREGKTVTSGSGDTRLWVTESLESTISGSGDVYYRGNPTIDSHIYGSGKLIKQ